MPSGPDQSNKLSILDGNDASASPDYSQAIWKNDYVIRVFRLFKA